MSEHEEHEELENRLSSLSLTAPSAGYSRTGNRLIRQATPSASGLQAVRLNYALAATLILSLGANLLQLAEADSATGILASQCEVNAAASGSYSPIPADNTTLLDDSRRQIPASTPQFC